MELRKLFTMIFIIGLSTFSVFGQSLNTLSNEELEAKKKEAIASENFELAKQIKAEQDARKSIDEKLKEKNEELEVALAAEDFEKAELLKKDIAQLEANKAKLIELEEDRKIAIFQERYDDVMAIEQQMEGVRRLETIDPNNPETIAALTKLAIENQKNGATATTTNNGGTYFKPVAPGAGASLSGSARRAAFKKTAREKTASHKQDLIDKPYNTKVLGAFNGGFGSDSYGDAILASHFSNSRWWINKYLAGGTYFNFAFPEEGTLDGGAHIMGLADFDSQILPYTSFGFGMGIDVGDGEFYTPAIFRVGSHFFFNKHRSLGLSIEFMQYFNNENIPKLRFGLVWTRMKRKHNTWVQNKK
jgi:hypothetical protein